MKSFSLLVLFLIGMITVLHAQTYSGAELRTFDSFTYGRFEANYKAAYGSGVLSNFFTYNDFDVCCNEWNEIDFEVLGRYGNDIQTTTIGPRQRIYNSHEHFDFAPFDSFYTYAFEWTPEYVAWFLDGQEIYRQSGEHISELSFNQKIMMNIWSSEAASWVGEWDAELLPFFAYYDWFAYYEYTPDAGNYGSDNNFSLSWRDEFTHLDTTRWERGTHTFPGNRVRFSEDNVIFRDGQMILAITDPQARGYTDAVAPSLLWTRINGHTITAQFSEKINTDDALNIENYAFSPLLTVTDIQLLAGDRTVQLEVEEADPQQLYSLVIYNIKDQFETPNTRAFDFSLVVNNPLDFPIKINSGSDIAYGDYLADQVWGHDKEYGHMDGHHRSHYDTPITETMDDSLFQAQLEEVVQYKIRVPKGYYNVELGFAELEHEESGVREFDLWIEDTLVFLDKDIADEHGFARALIYPVNGIYVSDGILDFYFDKWTSHPVINSITVEQVITAVGKPNHNIPTKSELKQNYPNPFNPRTTIKFYLEKKSYVELEVFDITGKRISTLYKGEKEPGQHKVMFNGQNLSSGLYFYKIKVHDGETTFSDNKKMLIIK